MAVEAAVRKLSFLHDGVDAHAVEASLAEQPRRRLDDALRDSPPLSPG